MRLYRLDLAISVSLLAAPVAVFAQGQPQDPDRVGPVLQESGLEDDDDLLDPDLDGAARGRAATANVATPPVAEKMRVDDEAALIGRSADEVADEMKELLRQYRADPKAANSEIARRLQEADTRLSSLQTRVDALETDLEKREGRQRARRRQRGTYGTPLDLNRPVPNTPSRRPGEQQFDWWHGSSRKALGGLPKGLKLLGEKRINGLKSHADALALSVERRYRPYANSTIRQAVGTGRLGQPIFDRRLNDLLLGDSETAAQVAPADGGQDQRPASKGPAVDFNTREPVVLLPRVRDPVTGRTRVVVDMPLGGPFTPAQPDD